MTKAKKEVTIRSSAAEYLTFVATTGDNPTSIEVRYEDSGATLEGANIVKKRGCDT